VEALIKKRGLSPDSTSCKHQQQQTHAADIRSNIDKFDFKKQQQTQTAKQSQPSSSLTCSIALWYQPLMEKRGFSAESTSCEQHQQTQPAATSQTSTN
jgi:hypothetical protein